MEHESNDVEIRRAAGAGAAATCTCSARLAPDVAYCHQCGQAQVEDSWDECEIGYRRGRLHGEFTAVYRGEAPWSLAGRSEEFRWIGRGHEPPRTANAEERLGWLCRALEREGWKRYHTGAVDPWYRLTFRRGFAAPEPELVPEAPQTIDLEGQSVLTLVQAEEIEQPAEVQVPETPVEALPVALEVPEYLHEPDPEPLVRLSANVPEPEEDVVGGPWYRQPPRPVPATALSEESELCSRIGVYSARAG